MGGCERTRALPGFYRDRWDWNESDAQRLERLQRFGFILVA